MQCTGNGRCPRMFAEHNGAVPSKGLRGQFLVGPRVFHQTIDVDSGLVSKCAGTNDRLSWRDGAAGCSSDEFGESRQLRQIHAALVLGKAIQTCHHLFKCCVAGPFPETENADTRMGCATANCSKRICGGESQIVMSMKLKFEKECRAQGTKDLINPKWLHAAECICEAEAMRAGASSRFRCG